VITAGLVAFLAFSLCASAAYLVNDLLDLDADRRHPTKRTRPLACGDLSLGAAIALVPGLLAAGGALAMTMPPVFALVLAVYVVMTLAYSLALKHIALADVVTLASLYGLRVLAGFAATGIEISAWLLAFSLFFFLNLAFLKRYSELHGLHKRGEFSEKARDYFPGDLEIVANFGTASGYISVLVFALYTNSERVVPLYSSPILLWFICPLQLYWIGRIWLLTHRGEMHEDPVVWAMTDRTSYVVGALVVSILVLASLT
jgi:4-hydroxybenzoate polyprenyltransferase